MTLPKKLWKQLIRLIKHQEMLTLFIKTNQNVMKIIKGKHKIRKQKSISNQAEEVFFKCKTKLQNYFPKYLLSDS